MFKYAHIPRHCEGVARGNPLLFLKGGIRILSRYALRMTYNLVIANTYGVRLYFRLPVIAAVSYTHLDVYKRQAFYCL